MLEWCTEDIQVRLYYTARFYKERAVRRTRCCPEELQSRRPTPKYHTKPSTEVQPSTSSPSRFQKRSSHLPEIEERERAELTHTENPQRIPHRKPTELQPASNLQQRIGVCTEAYTCTEPANSAPKHHRSLHWFSFLFVSVAKLCVAT